MVDLCGGTGATAAVLLEFLPPGARVISVDAAAAMQAAGQHALPDPRVSWVTARTKTRPGTSASPPTPWSATRRSGRPTPPPSSPQPGRRCAPARPARLQYRRVLRRPPLSAHETAPGAVPESADQRRSRRTARLPALPGSPAAGAADRRPGVRAQLRAAGLHGPGHRDRHAHGHARGETRVADDSRVRPPARPVHLPAADGKLRELAYAPAHASQPVTTAWLVVTAEA